MDLHVQLMPTATPLSRKRSRDTKAHSFYTVRGHTNWDPALQVYINDNDDHDDEAEEDLILTSATPSRSVSSSSTWKRRRVSKLKDDNELELEYVDSAPPSPWITNYRQPSPLELTECTLANDEQDLPKERKRHREEWEELKGLYMEAIAAYESKHLLHIPPVTLVTHTFIQPVPIPVRLSTSYVMSSRNAMDSWLYITILPFSLRLWFEMKMELGLLIIYLDRTNVCSGTGVDVQATLSLILRQSKKPLFTGLLRY